MFTYTCNKCGSVKHMTGTTRTLLRRGETNIICGRCTRRIREAAAKLRRGV